MGILIAGLVLFLGVHAIPMFQGLRGSLQERFGENGYKGFYSLLALAGLALIVFGYAQARYNQPILWIAPDWAPHLTATLMLFSLILLAAADISGKIKTVVRHPMITGVAIWGAAHLFANGGLADLFLFGGFLLWAVTARVSMQIRESAGLITVKDGPIRNDLVATAVGVVAFILIIWFAHEWIIGVPVLVF